MITIAEAITKAQAKWAAQQVKPALVGDFQVAKQMMQLAELGFEPSEEIIEPVRLMLSRYGVLLTGQTGVGKTFFMRSMGRRLYTAAEIADYGLSQLHKFFEWTDGHEIVIDDLGTEATVAEYGAKDDLMKSVIAHRCERQRGVTHVTTNLTAEEIAERYGDRTLSRLLGMCVAHRMAGKNRRRAVPNVATPAPTVQRVEAIATKGAA